MGRGIVDGEGAAGDSRLPALAPADHVRTVKVLHLLTTLDRGGAEHQVAALCRAFAARGRVEPVVAYLKGDGELTAGLLAAGIPVAHLGGGGAGAPAAILRAALLLREVKPDIVHTHLFKADLLGAALVRRDGARALISTKHNEDPYLRRSPWGALGRRAALRARRVVAISDAVARFVQGTLDLHAGHLTTIRRPISRRSVFAASATRTVEVAAMPRG